MPARFNLPFPGKQTGYFFRVGVRNATNLQVTEKPGGTTALVQGLLTHKAELEELNQRGKPLKF
jgi:hypothetical protein